MITPEQELECAKWLIVGFKRVWTMAMLSSNMHAATGVHCKSLSFMPPDEWSYGKSPVRGFVSENYPALAEFIDKHDGQKLIAIAPQIVKLRPKLKNLSGGITAKERSEFKNSDKKSAAVSKSYRLSRVAFKSAQGTDWNTCK